MLIVMSFHAVYLARQAALDARSHRDSEQVQPSSDSRETVSGPDGPQVEP
jgi:hypothetical protein